MHVREQSGQKQKETETLRLMPAKEQ